MNRDNAGQVKKPNILKRIVIISFAVIFFFIAVYLMGLTNQLLQGEDELEEELLEERLKTEELQRKYESDIDNEYIEDVARESLGYVKPYEKIFVDANK